MEKTTTGDDLLGNERKYLSNRRICAQEIRQCHCRLTHAPRLAPIQVPRFYSAEDMGRELQDEMLQFSMKGSAIQWRKQLKDCAFLYVDVTFSTRITVGTYTMEECAQSPSTFLSYTVRVNDQHFFLTIYTGFVNLRGGRLFLQRRKICDGVCILAGYPGSVT